MPPVAHSGRRPESAAVPMDAGPAPGTILAMTIPIVTELPQVLEAITADTFIAGDEPVTPLLAVRTRRIFD